MAIKILIAVNSMEKGGRTKRVAEEYAGLSERGHVVDLVTFSRPPDWVLRRYSHSAEWHILEKGNAKFDFSLFFRLVKFLAGNRPDVVNAHCEASALYLGMACRLLGVPAVGTVHRSMLQFYDSSWKSRFYYRFLDSYVAVSSERKGRMCEQLGLPNDKITVIHWGIDPAAVPSGLVRDTAREKLGLGRQPMILALGHLGLIKGHDDSIRALSIIREAIPGVKLYIGGDGEPGDYERLSSLIAELDLQESAILLGQVTNAMEWMAACDIFLQPSIEEAFGLVFIEAGLCRKSTIATNVGGIPEIIIDGSSGYLVKPHDFEAIAQRVVELLRDKDKAAEMGDRAYDHVMANFSLAEQLDKLERLLRSVAEEK